MPPTNQPPPCLNRTVFSLLRPVYCGAGAVWMDIGVGCCVLVEDAEWVPGGCAPVGYFPNDNQDTGGLLSVESRVNTGLQWSVTV